MNSALAVATTGQLKLIMEVSALCAIRRKTRKHKRFLVLFKPQLQVLIFSLYLPHTLREKGAAHSLSFSLSLVISI